MTLHRHRWEPRGAFQISSGEFAKTQALYVCESCGKPKTRRVKGHWTIADLRSKASRERDLDRLLEPKTEGKR